MRLTKFASALGPLRNGHPRVVEQGRTKAAEKNGKMAGSLRMEGGGGGARRGIKGAEEKERERARRGSEREKDIARSYERITARRRGVEHVYALVHRTPDSP